MEKRERELPWLFWLAKRYEVRTKTKSRLLDIYKNAHVLYNMKKQEWEKIDFLTDRERGIFIGACLEHPEEDYQRFVREGGRFTCRGNADYPKRLVHLEGTPFALFYYGRLPDPGKKAVAVVGSRTCSVYGRAAAKSFAGAVAQAGAEVVSGMACGIDAESQLAALNAGGTSCAVLGCGIDICYPPSSAEVYWRLREEGCVLSEYPPGVQPLARNFPARNRIISGLSDVVLVIEAKRKSGSLITADFALEQGRDVYAVPGRVDDALSAGCNHLIRQGAGLAEGPKELVEDLGLEYFSDKNENKKNVNGLAKDEKLLYSCVDLSPKNLDEILSETPFSEEKTAELLLNLQLEGYVEEISRGLYVRARL